MDTNNDNTNDTNKANNNTGNGKKKDKKVKKPFWPDDRKGKAQLVGLYVTDKVVTTLCVVGGLALAALVSMKSDDK